MIKHLFTIIALFLTTTIVSAQSVSLIQARVIAKNYLLTANISTLKSANLKSNNIHFKAAKIGVENKDTLFYILNDSENNAFVIVSADQRAWPILGYSTQGTFDETKQPDAFKSWMEDLRNEIVYIKANNLQADEKTVNEWTQLKSATLASQSSGVEPLLKTTWDQGCYYNEQCPGDAEGLCGRVWTGCTATAMAQIMKYWNYPNNGTGSSSLESKYGMLFADFGSTNYQWSQMPDNLTNSNSEVAKLMFHCGVAASIWYCIGGSGAYLADAANGLKRNFFYSNNLKEVHRGSNVEDWIALLKLELDSHRPILYAGSGSEGHAFVCDGYKDENYFHFNWGWGGAADGYFYIGGLNPGRFNFNKQQHVLINICPKNSPQGFVGFSLATNSLLLTANKSTSPVTVISSVSWTASSNQSWVKLNSNAGNAETGQLEVITEENSTGNSRSAIVTISTVEFGFQTITVTQPAMITTTAGDLRNVLSGKIGETKSITLAGTIDARDFKTMRDEMPMLETIDLTKTSIIEYSGTEGTNNNQTQTYEANTIPGYAFKKDDDKDTIASGLRTIVLPTTLETIDSYAFNKCGNLSTLIIPESVKTIKSSSFTWCWFLRELTIPSSVKTIENMAFYPCERLKEINVDKNNLYFSSNDGILFDKNQTALIICPQGHQGNCDIPTSVKLIKKGAFFSRLLNSINIPVSVDSIENGAIGFCNASVTADANNPKYSSRDGVLYNKNQTELLFCPSSKKGNFTVPEGVKSIVNGAFGGCKFSSVTVPNSVTSIGQLAFNSCTELESIEIPSSVTSIGEMAFIFCYKLLAVKIPSSVNFIGKEAFGGCSKLTSITIGHSVPINSGKDIFLYFDKSNCTLYVPYGVKAVYQATDYWKDFKNVVEAPNGFSISAATAQIGAEAGSSANVELKANVSWTASYNQGWLTLSANSGTSNASLKLTAEANTAFVSRVATLTVSATGYDSQKIVITQHGTAMKVTAGTLLSTLTSTELSLMTNLTLTGTIDARDFKTMRDKMPMLEEIDLSKASIVAYSGTDGTDGINQTSIYPANTIPSSAFMKDWKGKKSLKSIILPASLTKIDWSAFRDCDGLTTITIPSTVIEIGENVFELCSGLTSIEIPATVSLIGNSAFGFCSSSVIVDAGNPNYSSRDGVLYNKNQTELLFCPSSKKGNFTVPEGIKSIANSAFGGCNFSSVTIPNSVTSIGQLAFNSCVVLESIEIPLSVTSIGESAFTSCYKLSSVKIPPSIKFIGNYAFVDCLKLLSIIVGHSVPINLQKDVFKNFDTNTCVLYVPYGSKATYQVADNWKDFKNIVEETNGISLSTATAQIGSEAGSTSSFELKANVNWTASCDQSWLTVSNSSGTSNALLKLTAEENTAFVSRMATVTVSATGHDSQTIVVTQSASKAVFEVIAGTLSSTLTATELSLVSKLTLTGTIDARDFRTMRNNMPLLEEIDLSKTTIVAYTGTEGTDFLNNTGIYASNTVPFSAFMKDWQGKKNLKSIMLPASLTKIDWSAFRDCDGLTTISIPPSVMEVSGYIFQDCEGLSSIEIPATVSAIGSGVFWNCKNLSSIKVYRSSPIDFAKSFSTDVFTGVNKNTCTLYVPYGSKAAYQEADQWKDFLNIVEMPFDHEPYVKNPLQNISAKPGAINQVIDLKTVFADDDLGDILYYFVDSNTNNQVVKANMEASILTLIFSNMNIGQSEIIITASSNGKLVQTKFIVEVKFPTGISPNSKVENLSAYPNPSSGKVKLEFNQIPNEGINLVVFDLSGKVILNQFIRNKEEWIDLSGNLPGTYFIKTNQNNDESQKIILE